MESRVLVGGKYDVILVVTFKKNHNDSEMIASDLSMREKYQGNGKAKFFLCEVKDIDVNDALALAYLMYSVIGEGVEGRRLGIYVGTHCDVASLNPEVPAKTMGNAIGYLATRYKFIISKVCVDACYSAGAETSMPHEDSLAKQVGRAIAEIVSVDEADEETELTLQTRKARVIGCRIAGYCVIIKRYTPNHEYFSNHPKNYPENITAQAVYGKGTAKVFRPKVVAGKYDIKAKNKKIELFKEEEEEIANLDQGSPLYKFIKSLNAYFALKKAWKIDENLAIVSIPLHQYTDSPLFSRFAYDPQGQIVKFRRGDVLTK